MENEILRILLADDDESDQLLFKEAFDELNKNSVIQFVNNGIQLMNYLIKKDSDLPHLIFLDLNMPLKNGVECLIEIRGNEKFNAVPIIIYSTSASKNNIEDTFRNGANVYLKKPSDFGTLKQLLEKVVTSSYVYSEKPFKIENFILNL
jgi:CheY-like chemotaxis protein